MSFDLVASTKRDLMGHATLYRRGQLSIGILKINLERAADRLELPHPSEAAMVRSFFDLLNAIDVHQDGESEREEVFIALDRLEAWVSDSVEPLESARTPSPRSRRL